ncbi:beta-propeller fold lactonase family protein [Ramlibacter sp. MAH-25]|uniref:Beta-propeller fold lactonase family protein n=1 Tax=Ramlibacter pinisoli TaxID=2682844 RepID=A0A6N8IVL6_9BURK|nr:lactonase family protein [Ramlibacter sp. CGMCC 1.13660]MVQ30994.1 beta-propeller fold lactonase family protein [Ramlibacter pinisoli]
MVAYAGSRTTRERNARGEGISVFEVDEASGDLRLLQVIGDLVNPSYLAANRGATRLYAVHGDGQEASAFSIGAGGRLEAMGSVDCGGRNPVHLALDPAERSLVVSGHLSGLVAVLPVEADGALGRVAQSEPLPGEPGPHRIEQPFSKPHFNLFDPSGRWVIVPDKGLDRIFSFRFAQGRLVPAVQPWVPAREGAGPRHAVFHPRLPRVYVLNELDSTVTTYAFDADTGALQPLHVLSSLPATFTGNSRAAGIQVGADGRHLYASNRGHDSIAVFELEGATGLPRFVAATPAGGRTPRFFTPSPDGRWLYVLNEDSDTIVRFAVDPVAGTLAPAGTPLRCASATCLVFARLPA